MFPLRHPVEMEKVGYLNGCEVVHEDKMDCCDDFRNLRAFSMYYVNLTIFENLNFVTNS